MISKTISISKKVNKLDDVAALIYTWIQPHTDDYGYMDGDADSIKAIVVPRRSYSDETIEKALCDMVENNLITRYKVDGDQYIHVVGFDDHQTFRSDRPRRSEYPMPPDIIEDDKGTPKTTTGIPKVVKRRRKLSEVKLSEVKLSKETYGELGNVKLQIEEYKKLTDLLGEKNTNILIFDLDNYIGSKGNKYKSHYATLRAWARRKSMEQQGSGKGKRIISSS